MAEALHPADAVELRDPNGLLQNASVTRDSSGINRQLEGSDVPPEHAVSALTAWNQNKANVFKTLSTFVAFIIMGANDAAYGVSRLWCLWQGRIADHIIGYHTLCK